jgi:Protein of unknown function (DUF429)
MWSAGCGKSNVWIAEVECATGRLSLAKLRRVQQLSGDHHPFTSLVQYLRQSEFTAAAIDAPFSIPVAYVRPKIHRELLELVAGLESPDGRPFPTAGDFVNGVLEGRTPMTKKPLRQTEEYWQRKVNVRSTLWAGARGGAAMTAACLKLLRESGCPIWPWERSGPGLLFEAFPAAQFCHWGLPYQAYNGNTEEEGAKRRLIVQTLATRVDLRGCRETLEQCADALDALICAFAAVAVINNDTLPYAENAVDQEGLIAIERV